MSDRQFGFQTRALHAGTPPDPSTGARALPLHLTTSYVFDSPEHAAELFALRTYGNIYTRIGNPTVSAFEEKIASLEGGLGAVAFASGHAAQLGVVLALARSGDHLVATSNLYGGTITQFSVTLERLGIATTFVPPNDAGALRAAITPATRLVFTETLGNPNGEVADIAALAEVAHAAGVPLVVDNTFATPYLCRPLEHGADVVVHSATKFIGGHGTVIGGVVVDGGRFTWTPERHPLLATESPGYHGLVFSDVFGEFALLTRLRAEVLRDVGAAISPLNAWLLVQGIETLALRMERHVSSTETIARWLRERAEVAWVSYAGLDDSPERERARRYLPRGAGAVFTFGVRGGREGAAAFIGALELFSHLANVGDAKSLVIHPASTTHSQLSDEALQRAGLRPETLRLSIGLEDVEDLQWDLERGLAAAHAAAAVTA